VSAPRCPDLAAAVAAQDHPAAATASLDLMRQATGWRRASWLEAASEFFASARVADHHDVERLKERVRQLEVALAARR